MSRKQAKKSNIHIGIFSGKSTEYNLAILETLFHRQATAWEIATTLQNKINPKEEKEIRYYRAQKIYSVIQRKSGRLTDLKTKGYIIETNGKWKLTKKGLIALYIKKPNLVAGEIQASKDIVENLFRKYVDAMPNDTIREPLGIQIDFSKIKSYLKEIDPTSIWRTILEDSRSLLSQGIELDTINEKDLLDIIMIRSARRTSENDHVLK
jgi:hypothetical protein